MELEFDCGTIVPDVGELGMALAHHVTVCTDAACIADIEKTVAQYGFIVKELADRSSL